MNSKGFSLVEVLIASGIAAALSLFLARQSLSIQKLDRIHGEFSKKSKLKYQIKTILENESNCQLNFRFNESGEIFLKNKNFLKYYNGNNVEKFLEVYVYDNQSINIEDSNLSKSGHKDRLDKENNFKIIGLSVNQTAYEFHFLTVKTARKGKNKNLVSSGNIEIIIMTKFDNGFKCSTTQDIQLDNLLNMAVIKSCKAPFKLVKTIDNTFQYECVLPATDLHESSCPPGEMLQRIYLKSFNNRLDFKTVCVKANPCSSNEMAFSKDNNIKCVKKCTPPKIPILTNNNLKCMNIKCLSNEFLQGITSDGQMICRPLIKLLNKCSGDPQIIQQNGMVGVSCN